MMPAKLAPFALSLLMCAAASAQKPTFGEQTRSDANQQTYNAPGARWTGEVTTLAKPQKVQALVTAIDTEKQTFTIVHAKKGRKLRGAEIVDEGRKWYVADSLTLGFVTAVAAEQIKLSRKASKKLGRKSIPLSQMSVGSKIKVEYYPVLKQVVTMTVEQPGA